MTEDKQSNNNKEKVSFILVVQDLDRITAATYDISRDRRILRFGESKIRIYAKIRRFPDPNLKKENIESWMLDPHLKLEEPNLESRIRI